MGRGDWGRGGGGEEAQAAAEGEVALRSTALCVPQEEEAGRGESEAQPLIQDHGHISNQYNLGQYPQYYPQQQQIQQGPSAPPQVTPTDKNNPHLYPTLPVA